MAIIINRRQFLSDKEIVKVTQEIKNGEEKS
jgi:hypothetical protein